MRGGTHLLVLDTETGMVQADFDNQDQWLRRIIVSPDGRHVVTAKVESRHAILWDIRSPTATKVAKLSHKFWIPKVVFSPDGTLVATAALDGTVHLWDAETGSLVKTFSDDSSLIDAQFSQNGNFLVTKNENETVRIWSVGRADSGFTVHDINESAAKLDTIVVSPDQQLTVTFCNEDCLEL